MARADSASIRPSCPLPRMPMVEPGRIALKTGSGGGGIGTRIKPIKPDYTDSLLVLLVTSYYLPMTLVHQSSYGQVQPPNIGDCLVDRPACGGKKVLMHQRPYQLP